MNLPNVRSLNLPSLRIAFDAQDARDWVAAHPRWAIGVAVYVAVLLSATAILVSSAGAERVAQDDFRETIQRLTGISTGAQVRAGEIEAEFQTIREAFPPSDLREIDVFRVMRQLVSDLGLDVARATVELSADVPRQAVGSTEYRVMTFKMSVSGDFDDVWALIQLLDQGEGPYETLVLSAAGFSLRDSSTAELEFKLYVLPEEGG